VETSTPVINPGVFSHVAGTFDPTTQAMKIYVNAVDINAPVLPGSVPVNSIFDSDTPVDIGKIFCATENDYFSGLIDEVELFNRVLSQAEIQAIVNAGSAGKCKCVPPPANMVSWWPGDGNANDIQDGNNGTLQNGATFAPGEVQQAFSLDGDDDRIDVADNPNINPGTGSLRLTHGCSRPVCKTIWALRRSLRNMFLTSLTAMF
jgi:hypothetical protein